GVVHGTRYLDEGDLDEDDEVDSALGDDIAGPNAPTRWQISPLMTIQDQIDVTTFELHVAQWYSGFRQRWITGWLAESEQQRLKAGAGQLWTFENPEDGAGKIGEFGQPAPDAYIKSRKPSLRHAATLSQTPVHELLGELVNLSAEALAAAEAGHERKVDERKTLLGESHEQTLRLA